MIRDNFIDALPDDDLRLKVLRSTRPHASLQAVLESAIELELFRLVSRRRGRLWQNGSWNVRKVEETKDVPEKEAENGQLALKTNF